MPEPHAITRARERYGVDLTPADLDSIGLQVAKGSSVRLATLEGGRSRHLVLCAGKALIAVVADDGYPITVLPRDHKSRTWQHPPRSRQDLDKAPVWARRYRQDAR